MKKKNILISCILLFLFTSCGFSPLHQNIKNVNFKIEKISYKGDTSINNYFSTIFDRYKQTKEFKRKFIIAAETTYNKNIFSKDKTGNPIEYEIIIETKFKIYKGDSYVKNYKYLEKFKLKNEDDEFQEKDNERIIKQNYASSVSKKLTTQLLLFK